MSGSGRAGAGHIDDSNIDVDGAIKVCKVREDGALALRLQEQEDNLHYERNIQERQIAADDYKTAKELQEKEDRRHREQKLRREEDDRRRAAYIQQKINRKELEQLHKIEKITSSDEKEARDLAAAEEKRIRLEKLQVLNDRKAAQQLVSRMDHINAKPRTSNDEMYAKQLQEEERLEHLRVEQEAENYRRASLMQDEEFARHIHEEEMMSGMPLPLPPKSKSGKPIKKSPVPKKLAKAATPRAVEPLKKSVNDKKLLKTQQPSNKPSTKSEPLRSRHVAGNSSDQRHHVNGSKSSSHQPPKKSHSSGALLARPSQPSSNKNRPDERPARPPQPSSNKNRPDERPARPSRPSSNKNRPDERPTRSSQLVAKGLFGDRLNDNGIYNIFRLKSSLSLKHLK